MKLFTTGGTLDKTYFDANSEFQFAVSEVPRLLQEGNVSIAIEVEELLRKDSLEMTDVNRAMIRERVLATSDTHILITHGTDTMVNTARALENIPDKTIVLTGAMQPARMRVSDAPFNIGFAVAAVQLLPPGVYIAMNAQIFDAQHVKKNLAAQRFEAI